MARRSLLDSNILCTYSNWGESSSAAVRSKSNTIERMFNPLECLKRLMLILRSRLSDVIGGEPMFRHEGRDLIVKELCPVCHSISQKINQKPEPSFNTADLILPPAMLKRNIDGLILQFLMIRFDKLPLAFLPFDWVHVGYDVLSKILRATPQSNHFPIQQLDRIPLLGHPKHISRPKISMDQGIMSVYIETLQLRFPRYTGDRLFDCFTQGIVPMYNGLSRFLLGR